MKDTILELEMNNAHSNQICVLKYETIRSRKVCFCLSAYVSLKQYELCVLFVFRSISSKLFNWKPMAESLNIASSMGLQSLQVCI